ncbi:MAG TPA: beta-ketoacyl synthase chain length factor [Steroidobacteraceae bacterium]|nr:beta-ketoacyl synthase chain length factor [Steroidobacteraceae bacterium]
MRSADIDAPRCVIRSVGIAAPGLAGWTASAPILAGVAPYVAAAETPYAPALLPPNERRRATTSVRLAFRAAEDAVTQVNADARALASVFSSSDADMAVLHRICDALSKTPRIISPTDFHNSVHNAASGYWSIGVGSTAPTTTVCAYDASFTAGLIEAVGLVHSRASDVLLVVYDATAPQPLGAKRPLAMNAGVAMLLGRADAGAGSFAIDLDGAAETPCGNTSLEPLRLGNPALRALPLLELVAAKRTGEITLRGTGSLHVSVRYSP